VGRSPALGGGPHRYEEVRDADEAAPEHDGGRVPPRQDAGWGRAGPEAAQSQDSRRGDGEEQDDGDEPGEEEEQGTWGGLPFLLSVFSLFPLSFLRPSKRE